MNMRIWKKMTHKNGIALLSGGLDSVVSCGYAAKQFNVGLALTFDYGQNSFEMEKEAAQKVADYYGIHHEIIKLDWYKDLYIPTIPVVTEKDYKRGKISKDFSDMVRLPNRNALFINIAACYADSELKNYDTIIIGANKEEAENFPDNSKKFILTINNCLKYSTNGNIQVYAPFADCTKSDLVALENDIPLEYIYSCYMGNKHHCGTCESCIRLKKALRTIDKKLYRKLSTTYFGE